MVKPLKYIDKFLKFLKTDRNTFLTFVLTLITIYLVIDRAVEILFLCFTGISLSYWGPIQYTLALACPVFAFLFSFASKYVTSDRIKLSFFHLYCISLYIIALSMFMQWLNGFLWIGFLSVPNYSYIVQNFSELIKPAFIGIAIYLPLMTAYPLFKWLYTGINDSKDIRDSIFDYGGLDLSDKKQGLGPYTCEIYLCKEKEYGKPVTIPENQRFNQMLVVGTSGSGKTSLIFEPMIARDMEKKFFFREVSKEMGYTALRTGLATLRLPYDNEYLNQNFTLDMLIPNPNKLPLYKAYIKNMILSDNGSQFIYKNLGITAMSPDFESTSHMLDVAKNFGLKVHLIDPADPHSPGLNPFVYEDPTQTAIAISSVLKGMYFTSNRDVETAFRENVAAQAIENLSILLKEMYPRLHEGMLPNLEDLLKMLNNFDLVEQMCNELEQDEELAEKYEMLLGYFKKNFYAGAPGRADTEKFVYSAVSQLDNLLRYSGVRNILCNRTNNLNYDSVLANGEITLVCTRRGDLGAAAHKAFGLFFILLMQYSVLRRPGNEKTRIPHFFYIDEFSDFICNATEAIFTVYRKYRVGTIISAQNLQQLEKNGSKFRNTITSNCTTKVVFGNNTPEDNDWWSKEMGEKREWQYNNNYNTKATKDKQAGYDPTLGGIKWGWTSNFKPGKIQSLKFKACAYKTRTVSGKNNIGEGKLDFLAQKYKEPQETKEYNFSKFTNGISESTKSKKIKEKLIKNTFQVDERGDVDPIRTDDNDTIFNLNSNDGIVFDLKRGNPNSGK